MSNYPGVDWAADKHDVCVADETGEELLSATFAHDERGCRCCRCTPSRSCPRAPVPGRARQVRPFRRVDAVRDGAHRRPPFPVLEADSDETKARGR